MNRSVIRSFRTQVLPLPEPTESFEGKTVIVIGANTGLGLEAALHFVRLKATKVILGCRDLLKAEAAKKYIEQSGDCDTCSIQIWQVDLGSFNSVKSFCQRAEELARLDVVIENAGLLSQTYRQYEGYERCCTVNVISTWLIALLLLPVMRKTGERFYNKQAQNDTPHLCIVGSNAHFYTKFDQRNQFSVFEALGGSVDMYNRYANTKLISLLIMRQVAEGMRNNSGVKHQVTLNMVDPGFCESELLREGTWPWYFKVMMAMSKALLARTSEMGARNFVWAAAAGPRSHGIYIEDCALSTPADFIVTEEGRHLQIKAFQEISMILDGIAPGIMQNI